MGDGFITRRGLGTGSSTPADLSNYYTKTETDSLLSNKVNTLDLSNDYYNKSAINIRLNEKMDKIAYSAGQWTPTCWWWKTDGTDGSRSATHYWQYGYYVRIGGLCHIEFNVKASLNGDLGSSYLMALGNLPYNTYAGATIPFRTCVGLDGNEDKLWEPESRVVGGTDSGKNYIKIFNGASGYFNMPWPEDKTHYFYLQGAGTYLVQGGLTVGETGLTAPVEGLDGSALGETLSRGFEEES